MGEINETNAVPVELVDELAKFKKMKTEQLRQAAKDMTIAITGEEPDKNNWDAYDRDGLLEIIKFRLSPAGQRKPRKTKAPKPKFQPDKEVFVDGNEEVRWTVMSSTYVETDNAFHYDLINAAEERMTANEGQLTKAKKAKAKSGPRVRTVPDDVVREMRAKRVADPKEWSFGKIGKWLRAEHNIDINPVLIRSICIGANYKDVI